MVVSEEVMKMTIKPPIWFGALIRKLRDRGLR